MTYVETYYWKQRIIFSDEESLSILNTFFAQGRQVCGCDSWWNISTWI